MTLLFSPIAMVVACLATPLAQEPPTVITPTGVEKPAAEPEITVEIEEVVEEVAVVVEQEPVEQAEIIEVVEEVVASGEKRVLDMETARYWGSANGANFSNDGQWIRFNQKAAGKDSKTVLHLRETRGDKSYVIPRASSVRFSHDSKYLMFLEAPEEKKEEEKDGENKEGEEKKTQAKPDNTKSLILLELATGERTAIPRVKSFSTAAESAAWLAYIPEPPPKEKKPAKDANEPDAEGPAAEAGPRGGRRGGAGRARGARAGGRSAVPASPTAPAAGPVITEPAAPTAPTPAVAAKPAAAAPVAPAAQEPAEKKEDKKEEEDKPKTNSKDGQKLVIRNMADGSERVLENVSSHRFLKDGSMLLYVTATKKDGGDGIWKHDLASETTEALVEGEGDYRSLALSEEEHRLAFVSNTADFQAEEPAWQVYFAEMSDDEAFPIAAAGHPSLPADYRIATGGLGFSESGARLFFNVQPPKPEEPEKVKDSEKVVLDVWSWTDDQLQPQQLRSASRDRNPSYQAVIFLDKQGRIVTLTDEDLRGVSIPNGRDARWGVATDGSAWAMQRSWDTNLPMDVYLVDVLSGERTLIMPAHRGSPRFSPGGNFLTWWDPVEEEYYAMAVPNGTPTVISAGVPHPLENELQDTTQLKSGYGAAGWLTDDAAYLVYDKHDIWQLDPTGAAAPICVTDGVGRENDLRFRRIGLEAGGGGGGGRFRGFGGSNDGIDPAEPLHLSAFHLYTKQSGFWVDSFSGGEPTELIMADKRFGTPSLSKEGGLISYTRSDFREYPDIWLTDTELSFHEKLSNANPQQDQFLWGDAELFEWNSTDGVPLQGILVKPEGFDPSKEYPMLVYFYERMSDGLHQHRSPGPGGSSIAWPFYASNGYLVFVPDIPYRAGYPGESAENAVLPAISKLIDTGFVDADAIGVQGHSWGGYQIAHLVTRTNMFTAAVSGAPVSNMVSAYGGIRWGSGMSRMFQYERTQSRLGGSLWEVPMRFLENSPIFYMDKVETPVLILHNDQDGAVPWYQGIEFFVALRRLGKPGWMLNYNGEDHGLRKTQNRHDYAVRMFQFFDHYLRGADMPVWMHEGIPATDKGRTLGLDKVPGTGFDR